MAGVDDKEVGRRVRAARWYKGLTSVKALAAEVDEAGLGTTTLYAIEQGRRHAERRELAAIAAACGLTPEFFTMDFKAAAHALGERDRVSQLRTDVTALQEHLRRLQADIELASAEEPPQSDEADPSRTDQPRP